MNDSPKNYDTCILTVTGRGDQFYPKDTHPDDRRVLVDGYVTLPIARNLVRAVGRHNARIAKC